MWVPERLVELWVERQPAVALVLIVQVLVRQVVAEQALTKQVQPQLVPVLLAAVARPLSAEEDLS